MAKVTRNATVLREVTPTMGLPLLSQYEDGSGRHLSWIFCIGAPGLFYHGDWIDVDDAWIAERLDHFQLLTAGGYEPPVIREHEPNGERAGSIVALCRYMAPEGPSIAAAVRWSLPDAREKIERGEIRYFSPGIMALEHSDSGEVLYTIRELSMTSCPHQKGATTHILAKEAKTDLKENTMDPEQIAKIEALLAGIEQQNAAINSMRDAMEMATKTMKELAESMAPKAEEPKAEEPKAAAAMEPETLEAYLEANPQVASLGEVAAKAAFGLGKDGRREFARKLSMSEAPKASGTIPLTTPSKSNVINWNDIKAKHAGNIAAAEAEYKALRLKG
jgi:hypothetical protein